MRIKYITGIILYIVFMLLTGSVFAEDYSLEIFTRPYQQRIDSLRRGTFTLVLTDKDGQPLKNTKINIVLNQHEFRFGGTLFTELFNFSKMAEPKRKALGHSTRMFNMVVDGNGFKWKSIEKTRGNISLGISNHMAFLDWAALNNLPIRHHCLFWANPDKNPAWVTSLDSEALKHAIDQRILTVKKNFGQYITELDVVNEMLYYDLFRSRCGNSIVQYIFEKTADAFPGCKLYLNDNPFIKTDSISNFYKYVDHVRQWKKKGLPFTGIGLQAHYDLSHVVEKTKIDPFLFIQKIEEGIHALSQAGEFPVLITEYDCSVKEEKLRADFLEAFYTMAFAHPDVEGIIFWDWLPQGRHTELVTPDGDLNHAGKRYVQLVNDQWHTDMTITTDAKGAASFCGYFGLYTCNIKTQPKQKKVFAAKKESARTIYIAMQ